MYQKGVRYLIQSQSEAGAFNEGLGNEAGVVSFALLSVLAADIEGREDIGLFKQKCLKYVLSRQNSVTGYIGNSMYNHGFATLALAESYGHVSYPGLGKKLQKAVQLIINAQEQNPKGAWRYTPESVDADSTVTGCQIVALLAARNAGLSVPEDAIEKGLAYLESCRAKDGSYGYTDANNGKTTLTAIGLLAHFLAKNEPTEKSEKSLNYLKKRLNYRDQQYPFYFEYYMSQALFQASPETWEEWNRKNIRYLKIIQAADGSWKGNLGQTYSTSAALLSLALNYRYMPIYERF